MDFSTRGAQPHVASGGSEESTPAVGNHKTKSDKGGSMSKSFRLISVVLLFAVTILIVVVAITIAVGTGTEGKYLNAKDFQALDISVGGSNNGDQIYFGNLKTISSGYYVLDNVYYIPATSSQSSNITLEPLVCQIDAPVDQMVVNRSSVNWWENLQTKSKVVQTILSYEKSNPKGPTCPSGSSSTT
jgi:hypothetical protein